MTTMTATPTTAATGPKVKIAWRDENYGSVAAVAAFRNYALTSDWSDRTQQRFRGCLKRAGFTFHLGRASFIADQGTRDERKLALCTELAKAGFVITAGDVRPKTEEASTAPTPDAALAA
ncbi:hypothetical protein JMJ56_29765 [Belnapia sp. T18]|uniref:Uncharacterized protein n=1 Tax=Belnapia arida TaxID=2804533 RepID=A0ABS1UBV5_9PROT|nr:hypothetical protein [Belnapia arida]MBL6082167.1 hypothetical protein [Belnapia arida]